MMKIEQNPFSPEFYTATMDGKPREVVIYRDLTRGCWWVGFEDSDVMDDREVGGFLGAQAIALEMLAEQV
jgi:hypothetical protein